MRDAAGSGPDWTAYRSDVEWQFLSLGDYIWKLPEFVEDQRAREADKLNAYFPADYRGPDEDRVKLGRELRMAHETRKIDHDFPVFSASSSFIHLLSVFEYRLLTACRMLERSGGANLEEFRNGRRGAARLFGYAAAIENAVHPDDAEIMRGVMVLRNCLVHASGMIDEASDGGRVRDLIAKRSCYRPERTGGRGSPRGDHEPMILQDALGDRLFVPLVFTHWLCAVSRNVLVDICGAGSRMLHDNAVSGTQHA